MTKSKYYVSVQSKSLSREQGQAAFEWEIEATDSEAAALGQLFERLENSDYATFPRGMTPGVPYHWDRENDSFDETLQQIYNMIHALATTETKAQIVELTGRLADIGQE